MKCDLKHFYKYLLRQLSQETGASRPYLYAATKLLHLKSCKYSHAKTPGGRVFCEGTFSRWFCAAVCNGNNDPC